MARVVPGDAMSDAPPRPEHARPPGWAPPVPPPAPVAAAPASPGAAPPSSVRPGPPRPAKPTPPAAPPKRPDGFPMLAFLLAFLITNQVGEVFSAEVPTDLVEGAARMVEAGSLAFGAALAVGLLRFEWWVGRAAVSWAASLVLLRLSRAIEEPAYYDYDPMTFVVELIITIIISIIVVVSVRKGSRGLSPPPSAAP